MEEQGLIYDIKLSSVGPANVTGPDLKFVPDNMGLAMKLHYLRGLYYFRPPAFEGLSTLEIKEPMFTWLNEFPVTCGRFRRDDSGRAYIKCNDCGVRFVEAKCGQSLDEWLEAKDLAARESRLSTNHSIGPDLGFSPLVYLQLTKFKCGGVAVGLSWAHVLGDAFSASQYMNSLGWAVAGSRPYSPIDLAHSTPKPTDSNGLAKVVGEPISTRRVDPVGDNWAYVTDPNMKAFSFNVTPQQLGHLQTKLNTKGVYFSPFEAISAIVWKCIAKNRVGELEPRVVNVCRGGEQSTASYGKELRNRQVVGVVKADIPIADAEPRELAALIKEEALDETHVIEEAMEREQGLADFIVYGANLTFVNLEEAGFYRFEYRGQKPVRVSYRVDGVGEKGVVMVLPGPEGGGDKDEGRWVVVGIVPENEIIGIISELEREGFEA